ncbi:four-carbon acid sugar kinase family protein [Bacillus licheniformis]
MRPRCRYDKRTLQKGADISQKILIVADDLTGANDTGVQFVKAGLSAVVLLTSPVQIQRMSKKMS